MDTLLFHLINRDGGPMLDWLAVTASERWFGIAVGALACSWLIGTRRTASLQVLAALAVSLLLSDGLGDRLLRPLLGQVRPCYTLPPGTFRWLAPAANAGSLPSLHAANLFAVALVATLADRRLALPLYLAATGVALSRIYVGVHWPSDVLGGALWGSLCGWLGWTAARRAWRRAPPAASRSS